MHIGTTVTCLLVLLPLIGEAQEDVEETHPLLPFPGPNESEDEDDCKWRHNLTLTSDQKLHPEHHQALETCLYWFLYERADKAAGIWGALWWHPPPIDRRTKDRKTNIDIKKITINQIHAYKGSTEDLSVKGVIYASWFDSRLQWNSNEWHMLSVSVAAAHDVWTPLINYDGVIMDGIGASSYHDDTQWEAVKAHQNGLITGQMEFTVPTACDTDYSNYPDEIAWCCASLKPDAEIAAQLAFTLHTDVAEYDRGGLETVNTNSEGEPSGRPLDKPNFNVRSTRILKRMDKESKLEAIDICLKVERHASALKLQLTLPVFLLVVLVLITPFFGSIETQNLAKLLVLIVQMICFQFLITKTPAAGFGATVPRIYSFYELTMIGTTVHLVIGVLLMWLSRGADQRRHRLPPPHRLSQIAGVFNRIVCCIHTDEETGDNTDRKRLDAIVEAPAVHQNNGNNDIAVTIATVTDGPTMAQSRGNYGDQWKGIFLAINNALSILFLIIYIFAVILLF